MMNSGCTTAHAFREQRLWDLIEARHWDWPRTEHGRPGLQRKVLAQQARRYPELKRLMRLRDNIAELRISRLANTIGTDGFSRCPMLPFWTRTSRCQPSARDKVFLPSLPSWLHGLLRPPPGFALVELDWAGQEYAIAAALSGDPDMIADYQTGDPHWAFGVRAGLVSAGADKAEHKELRDKTLKPSHSRPELRNDRLRYRSKNRTLAALVPRRARPTPSDLPGISSLARRHRGASQV